MNLNIKFDYRFDESNFFNSKRKAVLEYAGKIWSSYIRDEFTPIAENEILDFSIDNTWKNITLEQPIDDLLIFVSAVEIDPDILAQASPEPSGNYIHGSDRDQRFEGEDFEPWLGIIEFNSLIEDEFYFDSTPKTDDVPFDKYDFLSLSLHEIGHVLGIGTSASFYDQVKNGEFVGSQSVKLNDGKPIPLNYWQDHIEEDFNLDSHSNASLDPSIYAGERVLPSRLDLAILRDIGYEIANVEFKETTVKEEVGFNIQFDYRFDESNFFTAERKAILEYAADIWSFYIQDEFKAINSGTFSVYDINGQPQKITLKDSIDDLLIFPSAKNLSSIGQGDFLSTYFDNNYLEQRLDGENFEPWMGMLEFDSSRENEFYFDLTPRTDDVPADKYDFLTISLREIGHILGIESSSKNSNQIEPGARDLPSKIDLAKLSDLGYEITDGTFAEKIVEIANEQIVAVEDNQFPVTIHLSLSNVHRFYQHDRGFHFYTSDTNEIKVVKEKSQNRQLPYNYEEAKFTVLSDNKDTLTGEIVEDVKPVYRFYNTSTGAHIYTMDEHEKSYIQANLGNYDFEGIKYYAFESKPEKIKTVPVYRMLNGMSGTHLFTVDQNEINYIQENLSHFSVEGNGGIAFYVFEL